MPVVAKVSVVKCPACQGRGCSAPNCLNGRIIVRTY
jgi:hypothetical protein